MYNTNIKGIATNFKNPIKIKDAIKKINLNLFFAQLVSPNLKEKILISLTNRKLVIAIIAVLLRVIGGKRPV